MNTFEINKALKLLAYFKGTYPRDKIPVTKERPAAFIVNTDASSSPGTHWVAIFLDTDMRGEYFDPFGLPPLVAEFNLYLAQNCPNGYTWSNQTIQNVSFNSTVCGQYCILFVKLRSLGYTFCDMMQLFSCTNTLLNDSLVRLYIKP